MHSGREEEPDERDVDSAGVYYMSIEDFEWRPAREEESREDENGSDRDAESSTRDRGDD